jgi:hypothetical protein
VTIDSRNVPVLATFSASTWPEAQCLDGQIGAVATGHLEARIAAVEQELRTIADTDPKL